MPESKLYPDIKPFDTGYLEVSKEPPHRLYYEQYGNPQGAPAFFLHGGPGSASKPVHARYFNPKHYRIILHHQRGSGKSEPFLSTEGNTTMELVEDVIRLRAHLGVSGKAHIFGGSWGSFLALVYAILHPETVASLTLRGIFLGRDQDLYDAYQRDAQKPRKEWLGSNQFFPDEWKKFTQFIPENERGNMIAAYYRRIHQEKNEAKCLKAAQHWFTWEDATMQLYTPSLEKLHDNMRQKNEVLSNAGMEVHYFYHHCFLPELGGDSFILDNLEKIVSIPLSIVQGRYDMTTPRIMADELVDALNAARSKRNLPPVDYAVTTAGHTMADAENQAALVKATDKFAEL